MKISCPFSGYDRETTGRLLDEFFVLGLASVALCAVVWNRLASRPRAVLTVISSFCLARAAHRLRRRVRLELDYRGRGIRTRMERVPWTIVTLQ